MKYKVNDMVEYRASSGMIEAGKVSMISKDGDYYIESIDTVAIVDPDIIIGYISEESMRQEIITELRRELEDE